MFCGNPALYSKNSHVISQAVNSVDHVLSGWSHTAETHRYPSKKQIKEGMYTGYTQEYQS